jgi:hypothetical protein
MVVEHAAFIIRTGEVISTLKVEAADSWCCIPEDCSIYIEGKIGITLY